jgi:hypothetical protein
MMLGVISDNTPKKDEMRRNLHHGDRFIPCRVDSHKYELQYQHEEQLLLNRKGVNMMMEDLFGGQHNTSTDSLGSN